MRLDRIGPSAAVGMKTSAGQRRDRSDCLSKRRC